MQEIPIRGTSFLDEDAQSYPGKPGYFWSANGFPHLNQPRIQALGFDEIFFQPFNAGWSVNQASLPSVHLLSHVSTENMRKGVIINRICFNSFSVEIFSHQAQPRTTEIF